MVFFTVTASGGCTPPTIVANPPSGSTFPVGTTTVTATASDTCGNSAKCSFTVTVYQPVTIACPSNITTVATGPSGANVFFNVNASGGCSPPPFVTANPPSGSTFPVGTTTVLATASDTCGNSTNCSFQVSVRPRVPTIIILGIASEPLDGTGFHLLVFGPDGSNIAIQASTNLKTWASVFTNAGTFTFTDQAATNHNQRFYRAVYSEVALL